MDYYIMNKDCIVAIFEVKDTNYGKFYQYHDINIDELPFKLTNLHEFIESRTAIVDRYGLKEELLKVGIQDRIDLINLTYGVSMTDTFWIKQVQDKRNWDNVTPFKLRPQFDLSWFIEDIINKDLYKGIPDYSTDGNFPKCWVNLNDNKYLVKCGTSGAYNAGLEPLSEILFPQIAKRLNFDNCVDYIRTDIDYKTVSKVYNTPGIIKDTINIQEGKRFASVCCCFTDETHGLVTAKELGLKSSEDVIKFAQDNCSNWKDICYIYLTDALGLNEDRHNGNIGFIFDTNSYEILSVAPMYDNNLSLLCYYDDRVDLQEYVKQIYAKGGESFRDLGKRMLKYLPECYDTVKQISRGFSFTEPFYINEKRLSLLNEVVRVQACNII